MPLLKSGRHFALSAEAFKDAIKYGTDTNVSAAIMFFRMNVSSPEKLRDHLRVAYFKEEEGTPPDAPVYDSGFYVADILEGKADWSEDELDELRVWLETDERFSKWLKEEFGEIDSAIKNHIVWDTPLWTED